MCDVLRLPAEVHPISGRRDVNMCEASFRQAPMIWSVEAPCRQTRAAAALDADVDDARYAF